MTARAAVKLELRPLSLPESVIHDIVTAISELGTNALVHGLGHDSDEPISQNARTVELWMFHRVYPESELVFKFFDPRPEWGKYERTPCWPVDPEQEHGRGLGIVRELFGGWTAHLSRSRANPVPVVGKAVAFSVPIAGICAAPPHPPLSPVQAARELYWQLLGRGIGGVLGRTCGNMSVVSVGRLLNIWCHPDGTFRWQGDDGYIYRPLADLTDVAEDVVRRHEEITRPRSV